MGINNRLIHQKPPVVQYDTRLPTWKEMREVVRATRSASAPGPSGVPYIVYKRCKGVLQILWKILRVIWRRGKIVEQWRFAEGVWIPKEEGSKLLDQFRLISLLNTESKIFSVYCQGDYQISSWVTATLIHHSRRARYYLPTPPLGQDMTQGQFLSGV